MSDTATRLRSRARAFGLAVPPEAEDRLVAYFDLLFRWNVKMNLTGLTDDDAAVDRLLLEPWAAAAALPHHLDLLDLGSGGGSPAIPLAIALKVRRLVMVESKSRKAAFLREAARTVGLEASVECTRFESLVGRGDYRGQMSVVSIRGVRIDRARLTLAATFLGPAGKVALFSSSSILSGLPLPVSSLPLPGTAHLLLFGV